MKITRCMVNHIENPLGFDLGTPVFSWTVEESEGTGAVASRIEVFCAGECVADTGWANLESMAAQVDGLALRPRTRYEWRVSTKSDAGEETTSELNWFETGKMDEPWQAVWLECRDGERSPIFSKALTLNGDVVCARLYACGLGLYVAYIDGKRVGDEYLAPGTNAYDCWLQLQTYDVTELLRKGATATPKLSFVLGDGWYKGRFGFGGRGAYYGDSWLLTAELHLEYADGHEELVTTDGSWQLERSNITFSNIYDGEIRDDSLPRVDSVPASVVDEDRAQKLTALLSDRYSLPVRAHELFCNCAVVDTPSKDMVLDLGQNIAGSFKLHVFEPAGTKIRLQFGELLQDGEFYRDNLRTARAEYVYTSDGAEHVLEPLFTYYGYRYVKIEGATNFKSSDFEGLALYSDFDSRRGRFESGNALVNKLVENTRWGMRGNFVDTATDCPQRDERMGWTGDAQVFSNTALYLGAPYAFYRKYLHDMALEQSTHNGLVPGVIPSFGVGASGAVWSDATTFIPWNMYVMDGDASILAEHFDAMCSWVDYVERLDGTTHEWGKVFQFGDWLALDGKKTNDRLGATDEGLIAYLYYWKSTKIVSEAADVLGKEAEAKRYAAMADTIKAFIEGEYYTASGRCAVNTQTAYALSIMFGFGNDAFSAAELRRAIQENGGKLCTGFVGTPMLCPALSCTGYSKDAYDLLLNEDYPGWLFEVLHGATTVWERWNSLDDDGRITGIDMNSMNHYAYGAVVEWIYAHAAGFSPLEPGFRRALIAPELSWRMGYVDVAYASAAGMWRIYWKALDENTVELELEVPFGAMAEVALPFKTEEALAALAAQGGKELANGRIELSSGSYSLSYKTAEPIRWIPCVSWSVERLESSRSTEVVMRSYFKHTEMLTPEERAMPVRAVASQMNLDEKRLASLDADLRALAE